MSFGQPRDHFTVIHQPDKGTTKRIHVFAREFARTEARAIDDDLDIELSLELVFLVDEQPRQLPAQQENPGFPAFLPKPAHVNIGIDHRREMLVGIYQPDVPVYPVALDQFSVAEETRNDLLDL